MSERATAAPFPATRWSVVLKARDGSQGPGSRAAFEDLCRLYWRPLYAFARGSGCPAEDAADLTQDFFSRVIIGEDLFAAARPDLGRLRTFLLTAFRRDLTDAHRAAGRQKRGSGKIISFDALAAEEQFAAAPAAMEPLRLFEKEWAQSVIRASLGSLAAEFEAAGKAELFRHLRPFISAGADTTAGYDELSTATGLGKAAVRQAVHRLRERFRQAVRGHIADTLLNPDEQHISEELQVLQQALLG
jgi:RNA polymerase sigma factor (sigma-70 family)